MFKFEKLQIVPHVMDAYQPQSMKKQECVSNRENATQKSLHVLANGLVSAYKVRFALFPHNKKIIKFAAAYLLYPMTLF